jgi:hypothetical protein
MLPNENPNPNSNLFSKFGNLATEYSLSSFIFGILANFRTKKTTAKHPHYATPASFHMSLTRIE